MDTETDALEKNWFPFKYVFFWQNVDITHHLRHTLSTPISNKTLIFSPPGWPLWSSTSTIEPKGSWNDPTVWFFTWRCKGDFLFSTSRGCNFFRWFVTKIRELKIGNLFSLDFMEVKTTMCLAARSQTTKNYPNKESPKKAPLKNTSFADIWGGFDWSWSHFAPPFSVLELMVWEASNCPWMVTFWKEQGQNLACVAKVTRILGLPCLKLKLTPETWVSFLGARPPSRCHVFFLGECANHNPRPRKGPEWNEHPKSIIPVILFGLP